MTDVTAGLRGRVVPMEILDALSALTAKLDALLVNTIGECGESFRNTNDELQDCYLWACSDMAREIREIVRKI